MRFLPTITTIDEANRGARVAVLPIGSFEQHGSHLPLSTDTIIACAIGQSLAGAYPLLLLPPITISCSHEHAGWAGSTSIRATTLATIVTDVAESLENAGITKLALISGHGGNYVLSNVAQQANTNEPRIAIFPGQHQWDRARTEAGLSSSQHDDMHAGEIETSLLLHVAPELVGADYQDADHLVERPDLLVLGIRGYSKSGVIGRPSLATGAKGEAVLRSLTQSFADTLKVLGVSE